MGRRFVSSSLITALESTWSAIRARHPDLPRAVIIVASGVEGSSIPHWGHWAAGRWTVEGSARVGEVKLSGERLKAGAPAVLETLLHEAAHALAFARGLKDTSRQGRYHNKTYKALAEAMGLTCEKVGSYGWTGTDLAEGTEALYRAELDVLQEAIADSWRDSPILAALGKKGGSDEGEAGAGEEDGEKKKSGRPLYVCGCETPRKMRMSPSVFELGPIACGVCGEEFGEEGASEVSGDT